MPNLIKQFKQKAYMLQWIHVIIDKPIFLILL